MPSTKKEISVIVIAASLCLIVAAGGVWFSLHSYNNIIDLVVQILKRPDLKKLLTDTLFTEESYQTVYKFHWLIYPLDLLFLWLAIKYRSWFSAKLLFITASCKEALRSLLDFTRKADKTKKIVFYSFVIFYLLLSLYKISVRDIGYDEAWNYNYFINTPGWFPFVLFNTYPLYHFSAHFFNYLPFDPVVNIRLPAVLAGLFFAWLLFFVLTKYFSRQAFYFIFLLAVSSYVFTAYSCIAKGVMFSLPLTLVMFYSIFNIIEQDNNRRFYLLYAIAGVLNIAAVPTSFIFCAAVAGFFLIYYGRLQQIKKAVKPVIVNIVVIGIAAVFYLTTIINPTSANALFKTSDASAGVTFTNITVQAFTFFQKTGCFFFSNDFATIFLLVLAVLLIVLVKNKLYRNMLLCAVICIVLSLVIAVYSNNALPDRAFAFLFVPYLIIAGIGIEYLFTRTMSALLKNAFSVILIGLFIGGVFYNNYSFVNPPAYQQESKKVSLFLIQQQITTCYVQSHAFFIHYPIVLYYYTINGKEWKMTTWQENSTRYKAFNIADNYDCIITDTGIKNESLPDYEKIYAGIDFWVYAKKRSQRE